MDNNPPMKKPQSAMENIPEENIHYNILTRLPVKSILRFNCVSKDWYNLLYSSLFAKIHQKHITDKSCDFSDYLIVSNANVIDKGFSYAYLDDTHASTDIDVDMERLGEFIKPVVVGSCNGLLCIPLGPPGLVLCNPLTTEYRLLIDPPRLYHGMFIFCSSLYYELYGFGYDVKGHDYKIVKLSIYNNYDNRTQNCSTIYDFSTSSNAWKDVGKVPQSICGRYSDSGVVVNNKIHWAFVKGGLDEDDRDYTILTFDLHSEELGEMHYDSYATTKFRKCNNDKLDLIELNGCLGTVMSHSWCSDISIWVMKEYGVLESWTKLYEIVPEQDFDGKIRVITYRSRREVEDVLLLTSTYDYDNSHYTHKLTWYNLKDKSIKKVDGWEKQKYDIKIWACVASFTQIPKAAV